MAFRAIVTAPEWDEARAREYVEAYPKCISMSMMDVNTTPLFDLATLPFDRARTEFLYERCPEGAFLRYDCYRSPFYTAIDADNVELVAYYIERDPRHLDALMSNSNVAQYAAKNNAGRVCAYLCATRPDLFDENCVGKLPIVLALELTCLMAFDAIFDGTRDRMHRIQYWNGMCSMSCGECAEPGKSSRPRCWVLAKQIARLRSVPPVWTALCMEVFKKLFLYYSYHQPSMLQGLLPKLAEIAPHSPMLSQKFAYVLCYANVEQLRDVGQTGSNALYHCSVSTEMRAYKTTLARIAAATPELFFERNLSGRIAVPFRCSSSPVMELFYRELLINNATLLFPLHLPKRPPLPSLTTDALLKKARCERDFLFIYRHSKHQRYMVLRARPSLIFARTVKGNLVSESALHSRGRALPLTYLKIAQYVDVSGTTTFGHPISDLFDYDRNSETYQRVSDLMTPDSSPRRRASVIGETSMLFSLAIARDFFQFCPKTTRRLN